MSINFVTFSGNVAKDIEVKTSADGQWFFGSGSIGVGYSEKAKGGGYEKKTVWVNYKIITKYSDRLDRIVKGEVLLITGALKCDEYTNKNGEKKKFEYVQVEDFEIIKKAGKADPQVAAIIDNSGDDEGIPF